MEAPYIVLFAVLGLCVGSFLNVVIARMPDGESVVAPGSRCPTCRTPLRQWDNVPVVSWILLRGRCRTCKARISVQYPVVELLTAALWALAAYQFEHAWVVVAVVVLLSALVAQSVIDLQTFRLLDRITFPTLWAALALTSVASYDIGGSIGNAWDREKYALLGMAVYFGFLFVVHLISPRGMGFGDVKLSLLLGLYLGWFSRPDEISQSVSVVVTVCWALAAGCVLGVVFGLLWAAFAPARDPLGPGTPAGPPPAGHGESDGSVEDQGEAALEPEAPVVALPRRKAAFPFGPALALATAVMVLFPSLLP